MEKKSAQLHKVGENNQFYVLCASSGFHLEKIWQSTKIRHRMVKGIFVIFEFFTSDVETYPSWGFNGLRQKDDHSDISTSRLRGRVEVVPFFSTIKEREKMISKFLKLILKIKKMLCSMFHVKH